MPSSLHEGIVMKKAGWLFILFVVAAAVEARAMCTDLLIAYDVVYVGSVGGTPIFIVEPRYAAYCYVEAPLDGSGGTGGGDSGDGSGPQIPPPMPTIAVRISDQDTKNVKANLQ